MDALEHNLQHRHQPQRQQRLGSSRHQRTALGLPAAMQSSGNSQPHSAFYTPKPMDLAWNRQAHRTLYTIDPAGEDGGDHCHVELADGKRMIAEAGSS